MSNELLTFLLPLGILALGGGLGILLGWWMTKRARDC